MYVETEDLDGNEYESFLQYANLPPEDLLLLFKNFAPKIFKQKEANYIYKEIANYLTEKESKKLFNAWQEIQTDSSKFYSLINNLIKKLEDL